MSVVSAAAAGPLLDIQDLRVVFEGGVQAVDGVSLQLGRGETLGLVGESGSGKTTLAKTALGLHRPAAGRVLLAGRDVHRLGRRDRLWLPRQAQIIFQDPLSSLSPRLTIRRLLAEPLAIHGLPRVQHWPRVLGLMAAIGLGEGLLDKYPHQISGGQARRVGIARALILNPPLLVADEPTAGLDVSVQGDLLNLLQDIQRQFGLAQLLVSHNLGVVRRVADRVAVMYLGRIVELAGPADLFGAPAHPYSAALLSASPVLDPHRRPARIVLKGEVPSPANPPAGCHFHPRCPRAQPRCRAEAPALLPHAPARLAACHFPLPPPVQPS